jgi:ESS family glutamate:Na+ symporter
MVTKLINFTNESLSFGVVTVCAVCAFILIANILRHKIPLFRRSLMPTAVIAGLLGLTVKEIVLAITGYNIFNTIILSGLVYHLLPVGFIALCLREKDNYENEFNRSKIKMQRVAATKSGSVIISTYFIQALTGIIVTVILGFTVMPELNEAGGIMRPLGYGQGPQQASATGYIWDAAGYLKAWGEGSARNFGLTIAAFGFLWASIPGIILVNQAAKRKGITLSKKKKKKSGDLFSHQIEGPDEVPLSESIDKFSLQVCMVCGVYLITIGIIVLIEMAFRASGVKFLIELVPTFWGFAFMLAALVALCVKMILRRLVRKGIMHRKYPNSYMMNRISGASFDISITSALFLISVVSLGTLWIPVILVSAAGGLISIFYLRRLCGFIYKDYKEEAFLAFYGMLTGTIANGMILLREIDKNFETPASDDLVMGSSAAIIMGFPLLILIAQAPKAGNLWWVCAVIVVYFLALLTYMLSPRLFGKRQTSAKK